MSEYIIRTTNMPEHIREAVSAWYEIDSEIVRCRDCRYSDAIKTRYQQKTVYACLNFDSAAIEPNGFCKWGERRDA